MSDTQAAGPEITVRRVLAAPAVAGVQVSGARWLWPCGGKKPAKVPPEPDKP